MRGHSPTGSPHHNNRTDHLQKRELYQTEGVAEYRIVDPAPRRVEPWTPSAVQPEILTEQLTWRAAADTPALEIDLHALFEEAWEGVERPES